MRKPKTAYLSYIEETSKHIHKLQEVARKATRSAIRRAKKSHLSVTYLKDGWIIREDAEGNITRIKQIETNDQTLVPGERFALP